MSPRWNWDSPTPLAASECALPPGPKGGGAHSPAAKGVGESQFRRLEKRLALCLLCDSVCPLVGIGTPPPPLPQASVPPRTTGRGRGGTHSPACEGGGGVPIRTRGKA